MKDKIRRILSFLLVLAMLLGVIPLNPIKVFAAYDVEITEANFPDKNFRDYVINDIFNGRLQVKDYEFDDVEEIDVRDHKIENLSGIKLFKHLKRLVCSDNQLSFLNLSKNQELKVLECGGNKLSSLNLYKNKALEVLKCGGNKLSSLNVLYNKELRILDCSYNQIDRLVLPDSSSLNELYCNDNKLTSLDVSKNWDIRKLNCSYNQIEMLSLYSLMYLNVLDCSNNKIYYLSVPKGDKLPDLDYNVENNALMDMDAYNERPYKRWKGSGQVCDLNINPNNLIIDTTNSKYKLSFPNGIKYETISNLKGATIENGKLKRNSVDTKSITYDYDVGSIARNGRRNLLNVMINLKHNEFDPAHVEKMEVKEQPTKLIYTEGDKLELAGLVVTLTDNQGVTKDVAFADFATYAITAAPANETSLTVAANNGKAVELTKGSLTAQTNALTVKAKEFDPFHIERMVVKTQPKKLSYTEGEKLDLTGIVVTYIDNQNKTYDVAFKDFATYKIKAEPENDTALTLANNGKTVKLTHDWLNLNAEGKGYTKVILTAETEALTVKAKVFDPAHVEKMEVKEQPTKLIYTEGDKLELAGLVVTLTDNQGVTKDVAFADFATYAITAAPAN
ncbi:MAG: leucine-rich repeat domain-containing protein, partial [Peptoniphilus lacrimalis]